MILVIPHSLEPLPDGTQLHRADLAVDCSSNDYNAAFATAVVMIVVYPLGIPLSYAAILLRLRNPDDGEFALSWPLKEGTNAPLWNSARQLTSGASTPDSVVQECLEAISMLKKLGEAPALPPAPTPAAARAAAVWPTRSAVASSQSRRSQRRNSTAGRPLAPRHQPLAPKLPCYSAEVPIVCLRDCFLPLKAVPATAGPGVGLPLQDGPIQEVWPRT